MYPHGAEHYCDARTNRGGIFGPLAATFLVKIVRVTW